VSRLIEHSKSLAKQQEILLHSSVRKQIHIVQKDTASLMCLADSSSVVSWNTENSSKLSMLFDFDEELFTSKPYKALIRKSVKFSIRSQKRQVLTGAPQDLPGVSSISTGPASRRPTHNSVEDTQIVLEPQLSPKILLLGRLAVFDMFVECS
jgi:hypothetical protein